MIEFAALTFSFVTIFVLSSVTRNKRERRMNPKQLELAGYFLCGLLFASAAVLLLADAQGRAALPYVSSKVNVIGELVRQCGRYRTVSRARRGFSCQLERFISRFLQLWPRLPAS